MSTSTSPASTLGSTPGEVRVRFYPSPTGTPHVGMARATLFNWAYARHNTTLWCSGSSTPDVERDSEESYDTLRCRRSRARNDSPRAVDDRANGARKHHRSGGGDRNVALSFRRRGGLHPEPDSAAKAPGPDVDTVLRAAIFALDEIEVWTAPNIEQALKESFVDGLELKPRKAYAPVRVAISGRTVSSPLYESMELPGKRRGIGRLGAALSG